LSSDIDDIFGTYSKPTNTPNTIDTINNAKKVNDLFIKKANLLQKKETRLEEKEVVLAKREAFVVKFEKDAHTRKEGIEKEINELNNKKLQLESTVNNLVEKQNTLDKTFSDIQLNLGDITKLEQTETESNDQLGSLLKKIFG
jgi:hypothetical protein